MVWTEYRRSCEDDIIYICVDQLLVRVEAYEAVLLWNFLVVFFLNLLAESVQTIFEYVSKSGDLDVA